MAILRDFTSSTKRKKIGNTKLAYVAGILDGEGHFTSSYTGPNGMYAYIRVAITNTNKDLIDYLVELFGGNVQTHSPSNWSKKVCYTWIANDTKDFLKLMKPFVFLKRRQLEVAMAFYSLPHGSSTKRVSLARKLQSINQERKSEDKVQTS